MSQIARLVTGSLTEALQGESGLRWALGQRLQSGSRYPDLADRVELHSHHASADITERTPGSYPLILVYCEKVTNELREKFKRFSGVAEVAVEVRATAERLDDLPELVHGCLDGIIDVMDSKRGDWGNGVYYSGAYELSFQPIKKGGRNYVQTARVRFSLGVSFN